MKVGQLEDDNDQWAISSTHIPCLTIMTTSVLYEAKGLKAERATKGGLLNKQA